MATNLVVTKKGSILTPGHLLLTPGSRVPSGAFTPAQIREHLGSGYLIEMSGAGPVPPPSDPTPEDHGPAVKEDNVGESKSARLTTDDDVVGAQAHEHDKTVVAQPGAVVTKGDETISQAKVEPEKPEGKKLVSEGKWNIDPDALKDKSLDSLNLMVLDRDDSIAPFEDPAEARAFLSADFKPKE